MVPTVCIQNIIPGPLHGRKFIQARIVNNEKIIVFKMIKAVFQLFLLSSLVSTPGNYILQKVYSYTTCVA